MTFMLVSEDARTLEDAAALINELQPGAEVLSFTESPAALAEARERPVDVALLAANMPELDGLDLGQYLKDLHPAVNLVFMDPDDAQALDALSLHASGCLLLPVSKFALSAELDDLRYPVSGGPGHRDTTLYWIILICTPNNISCMFQLSLNKTQKLFV